MSNFSIKEQLESLNSNELVKLIMYLVQKGEQSRLHILEWLDKNSVLPQNHANPKKSCFNHTGITAIRIILKSTKE